MRLLLPLADRYHDEVAQLVGRALDHPVAITGLGASWHGFGPSIELEGVTVFDDKGQPLLQCAAARVDVAQLASLRHAQLELDQLTIRCAHVTVLRREDGRLVLLGLDELNAAPPAPAAREAFKLWVARQPRLAIEASVLEWRDLTPGGRTFRLHGTRVAIRNRDGRHRLDADLALPESLGTRLAITAELSGDLFLPDEWSGDIYQHNKQHAHNTKSTHTRPAVDLRSGGADIELWSDWRKGPQRITGTVNASDVQLALQHALREDIPRAAPQSADAPAPSAQPPPTTSSTAVVSNQDSLQANPPRQNPASDKSPLASSSELSPCVCASAAAATSPYSRASAAECDAFAADAHTATTPLDEAVPAMAKEAAAARVGLRIGEREEGPPSEWRVVYRAADGAHALEVGYSRVRIEDALALARAAQALSEAEVARLAALAPRGELRDTYLRYQWGSTVAPAWLLRTDFHQLALSAVEAVPGIAYVDGTFASAGARGVDAARWFRAPLPLTDASGRLAWRRQGDSWQIGGDDLVMHNEDIHGRAAFRLVRLAGMGPPHLDLYADFADGNGAHAARYLPVTLMHDKAVSWLDRAIVDGRVTQGEARLYGWLNEFPFDRGDGAFDVNFHVVDGVLDYAPGWPRLRQIATDVRFIGRSLVLRASAAKAFDSDVIGAEVKVADLAGHPAVVVVNGSARGPTAYALRFVAESPLREKFGDYLAGMEASGRPACRGRSRSPTADSN